MSCLHRLTAGTFVIGTYFSRRGNFHLDPGGTSVGSNNLSWNLNKGMILGRIRFSRLIVQEVFVSNRGGITTNNPGDYLI